MGENPDQSIKIEIHWKIWQVMLNDKNIFSATKNIHYKKPTFQDNIPSK